MTLNKILLGILVILTILLFTLPSALELSEDSVGVFMVIFALPWLVILLVLIVRGLQNAHSLYPWIQRRSLGVLTKIEEVFFRYSFFFLWASYGSFYYSLNPGHLPLDEPWHGAALVVVEVTGFVLGWILVGLLFFRTEKLFWSIAEALFWPFALLSRLFQIFRKYLYKHEPEIDVIPEKYEIYLKDPVLIARFLFKILLYVVGVTLLGASLLQLF